MHAESTEIDDAFGHWLAGFADGEGSFIIQRSKEKRWERYAFNPRFAINLRRDDRAILEEIQDRTGMGKIYDRHQTGTSARPGTKPQSGWWVFTKPDCLQLIEIFDRYPLRAKKAADYAIWRDAVIEWTNVICRPTGVGPRRDWSRMERLSEMLVAGRRYEAGPSLEADFLDPQLILEIS